MQIGEVKSSNEQSSKKQKSSFDMDDLQQILQNKGDAIKKADATDMDILIALMTKQTKDIGTIKNIIVFLLACSIISAVILLAMSQQTVDK